ncbi:MFS transporter [Streptomyces sp. NPDC005209]|uniref:MFS transporter n=1 Tax=Streptomyces sp. NPDC005209 TaxID=3156715 RepID=UPI0033A4BDBF
MTTQRKRLLDRFGLPRGDAGLLAFAAVAEAAALVLYMTFGLVYFTTVVGLPAVQVGAVLTASGCLGLVVGVPAAQLAERFGSRRVLICALLGQTVGTAMYALVGDLVAFACLSFLLTACERTAYAARGAIMGMVLVGEKRNENRAKVRSLSNAAAIIAALMGSAVLQVGQKWAYQSAVLLVALLLLSSAVVSRKLPETRPTGGGERRRLEVVRDRPFLALTIVSAILTMHFGLFEVLPLWIVRHTGAPKWMGGALFLLNALTVVVCQTRVGRGIEDVTSAGKAMRRSGALLCVACLLFGLAGNRGWWAIAPLVLGGVVYVWAEMLLAAAGWELSFGLAPEDRHAQYQAMYGTGATLGTLLAPLMATSLVLGGGLPGWTTVGVLFLLSSAAAPLIVRRALRVRDDAAPVNATETPHPDLRN